MAILFLVSYSSVVFDAIGYCKNAAMNSFDDPLDSIFNDLSELQKEAKRPSQNQVKQKIL